MLACLRACMLACLRACVFVCLHAHLHPCMQDGHPDGLSIDEQLAQDPFAQIINVKPEHGMLVIHTTLAEVYVRMWYAPSALPHLFFFTTDGWLVVRCVFEADAGVVAGVPIRGLFDTSTMTASMLDSAAEIDTSQSEVSLCLSLCLSLSLSLSCGAVRCGMLHCPMLRAAHRSK